MRVLIIGASKGIGLETTRQALDAGHHVRALARSAAAIAISNSSLEKMRGDALKTEGCCQTNASSSQFADQMWRFMQQKLAATRQVQLHVFP